MLSSAEQNNEKKNEKLKGTKNKKRNTSAGTQEYRG